MEPDTLCRLVSPFRVRFTEVSMKTTDSSSRYVTSRCCSDSLLLYIQSTLNIFRDFSHFELSTSIVNKKSKGQCPP